ncbi:NrtA/SsuA/CpmA family ABC transporter substrate-binding protein [Clostridium nigeriense]|uniref:NrtA/SsuA/CpmA family ABC transporter substrate-binding protein n=1 Tax=Clostridium nigeriense TaxID=1805470 RepID=UPI003D34CCDE
MKKRNIIASIAAVIFAIGMMTGCGTKETKSDISEINLTYVKAPLNVPSIIQKQDDLFGKEFSSDNIAVNFYEITSGPDQTAALASGELDILHALGGTSALIAASNGVDLKIINTYSRSPKGFMILTNNDEIVSAKDLVGKKVAGPKGTILHQVLIAALNKEGYSIDDVEFINMGIPEAAVALEDGSVDAALIAGPTAYKAVKNGSKIVANGEGLVDGIIVTAVSGEFAEKHPDIIERFKKVENETLEYINNNFDEAMGKVSEEVGLTVDEVKEMYDWYDFSLDITDNDIKSLEDTQKFLIDNGLQENEVNVQDLIYKAE